MFDFIRDVWQFLTGKRDHPIVAHEMEGWSYLQIWRTLRKGCLPLIALLLVGSAGCCGLLGLPSMTSGAEWPVVFLMMFMGLYVGGEIVNLLIGLIATALTATVLSAEVEAQTVGLLRLTPIPMREIVLAKYGAAVRQFKIPLIIVIVNRIVSIAGLFLAFILLMVISIPPASTYTAPTSPMPLPADVLSLLTVVLLPYLLVGALVLLVILIWFLYFLFSVVFDLLLYAAVGLLASSWSRTRAGGLAVGAGLRIGLFAVSYASGQIFSTFFSFLTMPMMLLYPAVAGIESQLANIAPVVLVISGALLGLLWLLIVVAFRIAVILGLLFLATNRAARIPTQ